ncbi:TonB-dependent receptor [Nafulsella turpanensis]|uniref:TonB-dependent receptor n=1 Tax=Nafulsella turpanensis TaxID=1265690 RepID=UPI000477F6C2|nr:TonB-dependent receptor [Nafulsella turpanensis]
MKKVLLPLIVLLFLVIQVQAQNGVLKGRLLSTNNQPVPFGNILIKGTSTGVNADEQGQFIIQNIKAGTHTILASAVGYEGKEVSVSITAGNTKEVTIQLAEQTMNLSEVVVSASRTSEKLREVPSSVTILTRKSIEENMTFTNNIVDILASQVPGMGPSSGTASNWGQTLRGRPMLVMVDGVPQSTPLRNGGVDLRALDPDIIQRIEVVKGATAIYGNGAAGGLINYITRTPNLQKPFSSRTSLGVNGSLVNSSNSTGARLSQTFYGKVKNFDYVVSGVFDQTGELKDAEGDVLSPTYGLGETDSYNGFAKLGYHFTPLHRLQLTYNFYSSQQKTNYVPLYGDYSKKLKTTGVLGEPQGVPPGVRANHNLNLQFTGENAFLNSHYTADVYYQSVDNVFFHSMSFIGGGQSRIMSNKKGARVSFTTPYTISSAIEGDVTYGMDALNDVTSQPLVDGRIWVPDMNMVNLAPFAQLKLNLLESLTFKGGFRAEKVNIAVEDYSTLPSIDKKTGDTVSFAVKGGELAYNAFLVNAGLKFNRYEKFTPYVSFSQGFSVADVGRMLRAATVDNMQQINTEAVIVNNYEAGFTSRFNKFKFEGVGFISTSELGASGRFNTETQAFEVMRSPEKIYGFEAIADVAVRKNLTLGAAYAYVEGKMDKDDNGSFKDPADAFLGGERITPPKLTAYVRYQVIDNKLGFNLQYTGFGKRERFEANEGGTYNVYEGPIEPYQLVNFSTSYKLNSSTTINVGIENLFNEDYFPARGQWYVAPTYYAKGKGRSFNLSMIVDL